MKRKRGRPATGLNPMVGFRAATKLTSAIDAAAEDDADKPSRSEKIRRIVTEWLVERGYLPKG